MVALFGMSRFAASNYGEFDNFNELKIAYEQAL